MRAPELLLALCVTTSCGQPLPGEEGAEGRDGRPGSPGAAGPAGRDGKDAVTAGSRLVPLSWKGADGTRWAAGWFWDKERNERCVLSLVSRGPGNDLATGLWVCAPPETGATEQTASRYVRMTLE